MNAHILARCKFNLHKNPPNKLRGHITLPHLTEVWIVLITLKLQTNGFCKRFRTRFTFSVFYPNYYSDVINAHVFLERLHLFSKLTLSYTLVSVLTYQKGGAGSTGVPADLFRTFWTLTSSFLELLRLN